MTFDRTRYAREWARRKRAALLAAERREATTCPRRMGPGICGGTLRWTRAVDRSWKRSCPRCERREAGTCQDCDQPVAGRVRSALRCATHQRRRQLQHGHDYKQRHYATVRRKWRKYHKSHASEKAAYKRLWRKLNREKVRAQKRRYALRQKARAREYHLAYRMAADVEGRTLPRFASRECLTCPTLVKGRVKKCDDCKQRERQDALRTLKRVA